MTSSSDAKDVSALVADVKVKRERAVSADGKWGRKQPIASDLDPESCRRKQVHEIVSWEKKSEFSTWLLERFTVGKLWEREYNALLNQLGFDVVAGQERFDLRGKNGRVVCSGKIDGKVQVGRKRYTYEVKSVHPNLFTQVRPGSLEDLRQLASTKKHEYQLTCYLLGHGEEEGWIALTDCLGHWNEIPVRLDLELAERLLKFAEDITTAAELYAANQKDENLPPFTLDTDECARCGFLGKVCQPPFLFEPAPETLQLEALRDEVLIWRKNKEARDAWEKADGAIKAKAKAAGAARVLCGGMLVTVKKYPKAAYSVAAKDVTEARIKIIGEEDRE